MTITAESTIRRRLDLETQRRLIEQVAEVHKVSPLQRLATPGGRAMKVRVSAAGRLGWTSDAQGYRYVDRDARGNPWPYMPFEWIEIANSVVAEPQPWDSAIVNWYSLDASLGWHVDRSEVDRSRPIVTISLGDSASWAIRAGEAEPASRCVVRSGDVTVLEGVTRSWSHAIERIIPEPLLSPLGADRGRLSITLRVAGEVTP